MFRRDDVEASTATLIELSVAFNGLIYDIAQRNSQMVYRDPWPGGTTPVNISRVAQRQEARFRSIVKQFPHDWPIHERGAYILRCYSGLQMFPDANHRTGLAIGRAYLRLHNHVLSARLEDWKGLVGTLKDQHSPYWSRCKADAIATRSRCFSHIAAFYQARTKRWSLFGAAREALSRRTASGAELVYWDEEPEAEAARKRIPFEDDGSSRG